MDFSKNEELQLEEILQETKSFTCNLCAIWKRIFGEEICVDNLCRLLDCMKNFYDEVLQESLQKEDCIKSEIDELRSEAADLCRLLNVEVELPEIAENSGVPLWVIQREIDQSLQDLRKELVFRREQIKDLLLEQEFFCENLDEPPRELLKDPLPTLQELENFRKYLDNLEVERNNRLQQLHALRREIKTYLQVLGLNVNTDYDYRLLNQPQIQLSQQTLLGLHKLRERFREKFEELKSRIDSMREKVFGLWERLNTPMEERQKVQSYSNYEQVTADILHQELERCEELKCQNLKQNIQMIREQIEHFWKLSLKSEKECRRFKKFRSRKYTDELLELHELELDNLNRYYNRNKKIFKLYSNRSILWERMCALEQKANDPARYNNRGGQLLKEEKERKTIATKLPKIEQQIRELVEQYQEREHKPFLVYGNDILKVMEADWEKKRQEKGSYTNARKNAVTSQPCGINRSDVTNVIHTPLKNLNASLNALRKTPSPSKFSVFKHTAHTESGLKGKFHQNEKILNSTVNDLKNLTLNNQKSSTTAHQKLPHVLAITINAINGSKCQSLNKSAPDVINQVLPDIFEQYSSSSDNENVSF